MTNPSRVDAVNWMPRYQWVNNGSRRLDLLAVAGFVTIRVMASPPSLTILIVSHNKPELLPEAVASVLGQTHENWQGILIDSGVLHDRGYFARFPWVRDPRLCVVRSPETPALRRHKAMAPWCFNECLRRGWVQGELVMYLCDDDILYPNAFATFVEAFQKQPAAMAMYAAQDIGWIGPNGERRIVGERRAQAPGGKCCNGRIMDCQVDYLQLCHRRSALQAFDDQEVWPEARTSGAHADGLFMEKLGKLFPILPLDVKVGQNRRTPWSVNLPVSAPTTNPAALKAPVWETIMDAWFAVREQFRQVPDKEAAAQVLDDFQRELRQLCEQEHALRESLTARRHRLADGLHRFLGKVPGALRLLQRRCP